MSFGICASVVSALFDWHTAGLLAGVLFLAKIIRGELYSPLARLPGIRPGFLGKFHLNYAIVANRYLHDYIWLHERYGHIVRVGNDTVLLRDPQSVRQVLGSTAFPKGSFYRSLEIHRDNIFATRDASFHRRQRRLMSPIFSVTSIASMEQLVQTSGIERMVERVAEHATTGATFDIMELLLCMALDVIGEVSFGKSFGSLQATQSSRASEILQLFDDTTKLGIIATTVGPLCQPWLLPGFFRSERRLVEFARDAIKQRLGSKKDQRGRPRDVLQRLIDAEDPVTGEKLTEDQLIAESIVQLIGGTETTGLALTWTLHYLLENPLTMMRLAEELQQALPDRDRPVEYAQAKDLPYLNAVLYEALRLRPPGSTTFRETPPGGADLCGHYIPEGCSLIISFYCIHRLPEVFGEDADHFRPERWIDSSPEQLSYMRQMFFAFSAGARACIGRNLAWMELRLALATLVRRYAFHVPDGVENDMAIYPKFTLLPRGGQLRLAATLRAK
ncbi:cytochrome P450 [Thamnocephalis sphaerospora]|uniref:Cytochrome P450 n=1 Tax=Thamnocephalis sphaerospora TaxID=78915 RepID=A0A4P9XSJ7_9FUNG|nr:cytochrome P450 [Thamnocephalis sphaerospora]|eukprot:RKP08962.1 cytochrome P450 [Thamnocephalis sphaerospora]